MHYAQARRQKPEKPAVFQDTKYPWSLRLSDVQIHICSSDLGICVFDHLTLLFADIVSQCKTIIHTFRDISGFLTIQRNLVYINSITRLHPSNALLTDLNFSFLQKPPYRTLEFILAHAGLVGDYLGRRAVIKGKDSFIAVKQTQ